MSIVCYKIVHSYDVGLDVLTLFQKVLNQSETANLGSLKCLAP